MVKAEVIWWSITTPLLNPSYLNFEGLAGDWQYYLALTIDDVNKFSYGRIGTCFMAIGLYVAFVSVSLTVPWFPPRDNITDEGAASGDVGFGDDDEEDEVPDSDTWQPVMWKRAHVLWCNFPCRCSCYSSGNSPTAQHLEIVCILSSLLLRLSKCLWIYSWKNFTRALMVNPLVCVIELTEMMVTMGAENFMDFTLSYFVELCVMAVERLYLNPLLRMLVSSYHDGG